ncbi:hypothetical protein G5V59_19035 [Nocardioides sp. W3-2-3]|nr:hypothetical protein [Nocardioides convexus]
MLQGQESAVETLTTRVGSFTSTIAQREQLITQVIGNLNEVLQTVDGRRNETRGVDRRAGHRADSLRRAGHRDPDRGRQD